MEPPKQKPSFRKKYGYVILLVIVAVGIFLRTYHFHDWLRFNFDQIRDAEVVGSVIEGGKSLPLLGSKAGGTNFKLGPMFNYFQWLSARLFGLSPDHLAYPDLFFSILTIPLLFFFLKKYFSNHLSLVLTALYSISFYAIKYSRFAWNPNSSPFFYLLFLFSLIQLVSAKTTRKILWAALAGIALGVGVQLHTLFLLTAPFIFVIFAFYFIRKKELNWKTVSVIVSVALVLNLPPIISDLQHHGSNAKDFFKAITTKSNAESISLANKILLDTSCHVQANGLTASALGADSLCSGYLGLNEIRAQLNREKLLVGPTGFWSIGAVTFNLLLALGGYFLLGYFLKKEKNREKKIFLGLIALTAISFFLVLLPLAHEIIMRFFLIIGFIPFILLGLWLKLLNRFRYGLAVSALLIIGLAGTNILAIRNFFTHPYAEESIREGAVENITLAEEEFLTHFIVSHSDSSQTVYVEGRKADLERYVRSLIYLTQRENIKLQPIAMETSQQNLSAPYFTIDLNGDSRTIANSQSSTTSLNVADSGSFGRFHIALIVPKQQ